MKLFEDSMRWVQRAFIYRYHRRMIHRISKYKITRLLNHKFTWAAQVRPELQQQTKRHERYLREICFSFPLSWKYSAYKLFVIKALWIFFETILRYDHNRYRPVQWKLNKLSNENINVLFHKLFLCHYCIIGISVFSFFLLNHLVWSVLPDASCIKLKSYN